jgi:predicted restriction endonuclease
LLALWDRKCAVTGCDLEPVLRASHALSWQGATDQQRLDPHNGLPLIATLDALFDRGLISFADDGAMLCSPSLQGRHRELIGLPAPLRIVLREEQKYYLRMHRQRFAFCSPPQD